MEEKKNSFIDWVKAHRKELIIAGVSISTIVLIIAGIKNREEFEKAFESIKKLIDSKPEKNVHKVNVILSTPSVINTNAEIEDVLDNCVSISRAPHDVSEHVRKLPDGYKVSAEKLMEAAQKGISLEEGQTLVDAYRTGQKVA